MNKKAFTRKGLVWIAGWHRRSNFTNVARKWVTLAVGQGARIPRSLRKYMKDARTQ